MYLNPVLKRKFQKQSDLTGMNDRVAAELIINPIVIPVQVPVVYQLYKIDFPFLLLSGLELHLILDASDDITIPSIWKAV